MHLVMLIDVVTIASGIAIILAVADDRTDHASQNAAKRCTRAGSEARYHRTRDGAGAGANDGPSGAAGHDMISVGVAGAAS